MMLGSAHTYDLEGTQGNSCRMEMHIGYATHQTLAGGVKGCGVTPEDTSGLFFEQCVSSTKFRLSMHTQIHSGV